MVLQLTKGDIDYLKQYVPDEAALPAPVRLKARVTRAGVQVTHMLLQEPTLYWLTLWGAFPSAVAHMEAFESEKPAKLFKAHLVWCRLKAPAITLEQSHIIKTDLMANLVNLFDTHISESFIKGSTVVLRRCYLDDTTIEADRIIIASCYKNNLELKANKVEEI